MGTTIAPLSVDVAGVALGMASTSTPWLELATGRFEPFRSEREPTFSLVYSADSGVPLGDALVEHQGHRMTSERRGAHTAIEGARWSGRVDWHRRRADLRGPLATFPVDHFLRLLTYELLAPCLLVHAAALVEDRRGWLCVGPSGSGKSTLGGLFPDHTLCDDLVAVTCSGGRFELVSLPFWSGRPGRAQLAGIHLLRHDQRHSARRLGVAEAFPRLRREVAWPVHQPSVIPQSLDLLGAMLESVPIYDLGFAPDLSVWPVLTNPRIERP